VCEKEGEKLPIPGYSNYWVFCPNPVTYCTEEKARLA